MAPTLLIINPILGVTGGAMTGRRECTGAHFSPGRPRARVIPQPCPNTYFGITHYSWHSIFKSVAGIFCAPVHWVLLHFRSEPALQARRPATKSTPVIALRWDLSELGLGAHQLIEAFKLFPDVEIIAACDAYAGRLERVKSRTDGRADTYKDYREIIQRDDVDAVVISSPDHWHYRHSIDSLNAGKHAYIEKPMTYSFEEGAGIIEAQKKNNLTVQVGSPGPNETLVQKARQLVREGKIGQVTMVRGAMNRNTASGAWIYPIPPDATPDTVDWDLFLGSAPKRPYNPERFFRWRCYKDYSGGMSTDLYVHTCTTINHVMGAGIPESVVAMGGLYRWLLSRDVPDTINASLRYKEGFMVSLSGTFNNRYGGSGGLRFMGTEGTLAFSGGLRFIPERVNESNGWIVDSWPEDLAEAYYNDPRIAHEEQPNSRPPGRYRGRGGLSCRGSRRYSSALAGVFGWGARW